MSILYLIYADIFYLLDQPLAVLMMPITFAKLNPSTKNLLNLTFRLRKEYVCEEFSYLKL